MNLDKSIATIEAGFQKPETIMRRIEMPQEQLAQYGLRRKGQDPTIWVWMLSVGERGAQPTAFFIHHHLNTAMKKALEWRGVAPNKRGPRKTNGAQPQQAQAPQAQAR